MSDEDELRRLRARVRELEGSQGAGAASVRGRSPWRSVTSAVLIVLACVLAPLSVTATWASTQISDTDAYVRTVAPLADDPAIQNAVADDVTDAVLSAVDVRTLSTDLLDTLAQQPNVPPRLAAALPALAVPITRGVEGFARDQVDSFVASDQFARLWEEVNRVSHDQVVKLLEGNGGGTVSAQGDTVTLNLGPIVAEVKQRLLDRGFSLADNIPAVNRSFVLAQSDAVTNAQSTYRLLNALGLWLPLVALALFVGGVLLAQDRRKATERGALGVAGAMIVLGVGLALARTYYVDAVPTDVLSPAAAGSSFDTLVRFLRTGLRAAAVLALIVALVAFLAGPSSWASRIRTGLQGGVTSMRGSAEQAGFEPGRAGVWAWAHKRALQVTLAVLGGLVLVFWSQPSGWTVLGVALAVLLAVGIVDFVATPPRPEAAGATASVEAQPAAPVQVPSQRTSTTDDAEEPVGLAAGGPGATRPEDEPPPAP